MDETTEKKPNESNFKDVSLQRSTIVLLDKFKENRTKRLSYNSIVMYLLTVNSQRLREDECEHYIKDGTTQDRKELIEKLLRK